MKPEQLIEHPEGGRFREVFRSVRPVQTVGEGERSALTHIYFSLKAGEVSRFHKVASDEVWNLYRGEGVRLHTWGGVETQPTTIVLSAELDCFCTVIPAGVWQAAEPLSDEVLVGCSVAPGFEFSDFEMMAPDSEEGRRLRSMDPTMKRFIAP